MARARKQIEASAPPAPIMVIRASARFFLYNAIVKPGETVTVDRLIGQRLVDKGLGDEV
jgi:hypothetical protein